MEKSKYFVVIIILFMMSLVTSFSQFRLDDWKAHTSLVYTQSLDIDNKGRIWVATTGGLYSVNSFGEDLKVYRNINEMIDIDITAIKYNSNTDELYAGSKNGYLDILTKNGEWIHITDIVNQKFSNPIIKDIAFAGDKAYIAGGFGLAVFDTKRKVFDETVRRIAGFNANLPVNRVIIDKNNIWIATISGIAKAELTAVLSNPDNWTGYNSNTSLFETSINDIALHNGICYAMSDKFVTKLVDGKLIEFLPAGEFTSIYGSDLTGLIITSLYSVLDSTVKPIEMNHPDFVAGVKPFIFESKVAYIVKYAKNGIGIYKNNVFMHFLPDSPLANISTDMDVDSDGNLWIASDIDPNGKGIAKFDGFHWHNITVGEFPELLSNNFHKITVSPDGRIAAGNYGKGLVVVEPNNDHFIIKRFDNSNSKLTGLSGAESYVVCGKPRFDNKGSLWVPVLGNQLAGASLVAFDKDYKSYGFSNTRNPSQRYFSSLAIDNNGTKWVGGSVVSGLGLLYYNEKGQLDNSNGYYSGFLTQNEFPNIPDNTHPFIEVDRLGYVWIGTPRGLAVITNPSNALNTNPTINVRNLNRIIGEQNINYILVDAQNNKWLATNNGVWVINSDGTDTVAVINKSNSILPTNEVISLAYYPITGQVYFGTKQGIYEAKSLSIQPANEYNIKCYPQPFDLSLDNELVIDGLEESSDIRIVTVAGDLVKKLNFVNSKKAIWDGRDINGNKVPAGIYLVLATSATTKNSSVQKIAIINK